MQRTLLSTWKRPASLLALGLALAILMGWGGLSSQPVAATNASVDFSMNVVSGGTPAGGSGCSTNNDPPPTAKGSAVCNVPLGASFVVEVQLKALGVVATDFAYPGAYGVNTAIGWTAGLTGPGDSGSGKAVSVLNCPATSGTAAPFLAQPQTAYTSCENFFPLSSGEALGVIGRYELNCGTSTSQEVVTMTLAAPKGDGTHIIWFYGTIADANSSEVITIDCSGDPATPTPTAAPQPSPTPTTFGPTVPPPPPPGVGGVAFAPDLEGLALETSGSSNGGAASLLIAVSALAAGFVMLGGGVWYARRRTAR